MAASRSLVRVLSRRTVTPSPPARPRELIPLTPWDLSMLDGDYISKGLLFAPPPFPTAAGLLDHLHASLADALAVYFPVAGRLSTAHHRNNGDGSVVGCSVSVDCNGQGAEILHAVADGISVADILASPGAAAGDVPRVVQDFFPVDGAANYDGHELPLLAVQVTELVDGVFLGFAYNHALSDGTACWSFMNAWAEIARLRLVKPPPVVQPPRRIKPPVLDRWSPDGGAAAPVVLPYADLAALVQKPPAPELREKMLHFSAESLAALKQRARRELQDAGDERGAAAVTTFQALSSLLWRCITRARRLPAAATTACGFPINNRHRLRPPLLAEYFGNCVNAISTEANGHGWAAAAVGRTVAAHTDAAGGKNGGAVVASSPRFDVYGCDFGWGKPLAVRTGRANKFDGNVWLFPGKEGGGSVEVEVALAPEHMAAFEEDDELWAAVSPAAGRMDR
ncbi:unnamed protein product [Urochloa decumbens]|uniref:Acetyltransferase n=1 Tax=Urochloa decumbens TaxID=240449 RepID=A0ABC9B5I4_9POAL